MAKKLTETAKWKNQRWFRSLDPEFKLAYCYIESLCDSDGTWMINIPDLIDDLGLKNGFNLVAFMESCNREMDGVTGEMGQKQRVVRLSHTEIWLTDYMCLQLGGKHNAINPNGLYAVMAFEKCAEKGILAVGIGRGWIPLIYPFDSLIKPHINGIDGDTKGHYININKEIDRNIKKIIDDVVVEEKGGKGGKRKGDARSPHPPAGENHPPADAPPYIPEMDESAFKAFETELIGDRMFIEPLMISRHIKSEKDLTLWIKTYNAHIVGEKKTHKDYAEYRKHFKNWIMKKDTQAGPPAPLNGRTHKSVTKSDVPVVTQAQLDKYAQKEHV